MKHNEIMPECFIDTALVRSLLGVDVNHKNSCTEVTKEMSTRGKYADRFAVGIIDNDKRPTSDSKQYIEFARTQRLTFCKHPDAPHYLIKVGEKNKAMETFLLANVSDAGIDMSELDLPSDLEGLMKITKHQITAINEERLLRLFKKLRKADEVRKLKEVLEYLAKEQYNATEQGVIDILNQ